MWAGRAQGEEGRGVTWGREREREREREGEREAMPPITIIFHHPNYIVECVSAVACAHPVLLLGKRARQRDINKDKMRCPRSSILPTIPLPSLQTDGGPF